MLLITKQPQYGENGVLVVGDVAVTPMPDAAQLSQIAVCTAQTAKSVAVRGSPCGHAEFLYQGKCFS